MSAWDGRRRRGGGGRGSRAGRCRRPRRDRRGSRRRQRRTAAHGRIRYHGALIGRPARGTRSTWRSERRWGSRSRLRMPADLPGHRARPRRASASRVAATSGSSGGRRSVPPATIPAPMTRRTAIAAPSRARGRGDGHPPPRRPGAAGALPLPDRSSPGHRGPRLPEGILDRPTRAVPPRAADRRARRGSARRRTHREGRSSHCPPGEGLHVGRDRTLGRLCRGSAYARMSRSRARRRRRSREDPSRPTIEATSRRSRRSTAEAMSAARSSRPSDPNATTSGSSTPRASSARGSTRSVPPTRARATDPVPQPCRSPLGMAELVDAHGPGGQRFRGESRGLRAIAKGEEQREPVQAPSVQLAECGPHHLGGRAGRSVGWRGEVRCRHGSW